jgi:outer membrane receptor for ferrienterochelin and colicin
VYSVSRDLQAAIGNATDVLRNVPSVSLDIEGNPRLRGDSSVQIFIDGRPRGLRRDARKGHRRAPNLLHFLKQSARNLRHHLA